MPRMLRTVSQPWTATRVGDEILGALNGPYTSLQARLGFANASGVRHVAEALTAFRTRGGTAHAVVGVDGEVTSEIGVRSLARLVDELWLFRHPGRPLFHPKTYLFEGPGRGLALLGSANLTESALWINYEDLAVLEFDLNDQADAETFAELQAATKSAIASPNAHLAEPDVIERAKAMGLLPDEADRRRRRHDHDRSAADKDAKDGGAPLFPHSAVPSPPAVPHLPEETEAAGKKESPPESGPGTGPAASPPQGQRSTHFVLRLGHRDAQDRPGFSPDIFIPLAAYRHDPDFWGDLVEKVTGEGNVYRERYAEIEFRRLSGSTEQESRRLYLYDGRSEFRLNARQVHEDSAEGDLLSLETAPPGLGIEYIARVIKPSDPLFSRYDSVASMPVQNSDKRWGYA